MDATLTRLWSLGLNKSSQHEPELPQLPRIRRALNVHALQFVVTSSAGSDRLNAEQRTKTF